MSARAQNLGVREESHALGSAGQVVADAVTHLSADLTQIVVGEGDTGAGTEAHHRLDLNGRLHVDHDAVAGMRADPVEGLGWHHQRGAPLPSRHRTRRRDRC